MSDLEEGQVMVLQRVGDLQVLQNHGAVRVHLHHLLIVNLVGLQQRQQVAHPLTH